MEYLAMRKQLTGLVLGALHPQTKTYYVSDSGQKGLRVRVATTGAKTWCLTYRIKGVTGVQGHSLGPIDPDGKKGLSLAEARDRAADIMKAARLGRDLIEEEKEEKRKSQQRLKVSTLIERYAKDVRKPTRKGGALRSADEIERRLKRALDAKKDCAAEALQRADISDLLDPVSEKYPREAEKRRQVIRAMYRWGISKGYVATNPVEGTASYGDGEPRERRLEPNEIKLVWDWFETGADDMPPDCVEALKLQICLGSRASEVGGMRASELHWEDEWLFWTLPGSRSKNKKARVTPLVGLARAIVEAALRRHKSGPLFRTLLTDRALASDDIGSALGNRTLPCAHFTSHDLRRTMVSEMDEMGISLDTIAAAIGHQRGTKQTRTLIKHYSRAILDERVEAALMAWDRRLRDILGIGADEVADNVLRLRA
jgi:integrase